MATRNDSVARESGAAPILLRMPDSRRPLFHAEKTRAILDAFRHVHRSLPFGLREFLYSRALQRELVARGHKVDREVLLMVYYRGEPLGWQRFDMIVDDVVMVENKTGEPLRTGATGQLFGYLCCTNLEVGLVLHFGFKANFFRVVCENRFKQRGSTAL